MNAVDVDNPLSVACVTGEYVVGGGYIGLTYPWIATSSAPNPTLNAWQVGFTYVGPVEYQRTDVVIYAICLQGPPVPPTSGGEDGGGDGRD